MKHIFWREKKEPLCYGYLREDKVGFKVAFNFAGSLCLENPVGKNLIDFAWIEPELAAKIFNQVFTIYLVLVQEKKSYEFMADAIIQFIEPSYMRINGYFTMYLLGFIEFLLEGWGDLRLLSNVEVDRFAMEGYFVFADTDELPPSEKENFIDVFVQSITERQTLVEQTLCKVLGDGDKASQNALARFHEYETHDPLFRERWHSCFETSFGVMADNLPEVVQLSVLARIDDMLRYELVQTLICDVPYKSCQCCGKLFIPSGRSDSLYCDRIMPGQEKPCKQIGANLIAKKKKEEIPAIKLYRQAYERMYKRVDFGKMKPEDFDVWKIQAKPKKDQCLCGELSLEDFALWINETSRQR